MAKLNLDELERFSDQVDNLPCRIKESALIQVRTKLRLRIPVQLTCRFCSSKREKNTPSFLGICFGGNELIGCSRIDVCLVIDWFCLICCRIC